MKVNLILAQTFKFVVALMFITMVLFYVGILLMVPLAVLVYAIKIASLLAPTVVSVIIGVAAVGYFGWQVYQMPDLLKTLVGIGKELVEFSLRQKDRFEPLIEASRGKVA